MLHLFKLPKLENIGCSQDEIHSGYDSDRKESIYEIHSKTNYSRPDFSSTDCPIRFSSWAFAKRSPFSALHSLWRAVCFAKKCG